MISKRLDSTRSQWRPVAEQLPGFADYLEWRLTCYGDCSTRRVKDIKMDPKRGIGAYIIDLHQWELPAKYPKVLLEMEAYLYELDLDETAIWMDMIVEVGAYQGGNELFRKEEQWRYQWDPKKDNPERAWTKIERIDTWAGGWALLKVSSPTGQRTFSNLPFDKENL